MPPAAISRSIPELSKVENGVAVATPQSRSNSALIVVGSSKVVAMKFGLAAAKEFVSPVTMTGAPAVEFARLREPVLTTYWLPAAPGPGEGNGAAARPP